ncbi:hypothetical protein HCA60_14480 [Listeria booriae]|uniref:hypothetical protein n=1 Tax=Listeria booriae TaxID=1552123 RepID=UPI001629E282|nr:hypothetical protein [Listeria booriae]MBC1813705.1 hypothetical protein [Listeria booriae]
MATERDYNVFADEAYQIDKTRAKNEDRALLLKGDILEGTKLSQSYIVLEVADNNKNGMQAMAVAPIKDGIADTSEVIIAYAGTDFDDKLDVLTDATTVVGGDVDLSIPQW